MLHWLARHRFRLVLGLLLWLLPASVLVRLACGRWDRHSPAGRWTRSVWDYLTRASNPLLFHLDSTQPLAVGDPVFVDSPEGLIQVGEVSALVENGHVLATRQARVQVVEVRLYPGVAPPADGDTITYVAADTSLAWALETLLTPERKAAIGSELQKALEEHGEETKRLLVPIVEEAGKDALRVIATDLPRAVSRRRDDLERLGARYQEELVNQQLVPLVQEVIWPIVKRRGEPVVRALGRELWDRVSIWSFVWRYVWDRLPGTDGTLVEEKFQKFIQEEVVPTLRRRMPELIQVVRDTLQEVAANPRVHKAASNTFNRLVDDPELTRLVEDIFAEVVVENPRLHEELRKRWDAPQTQQAIKQLSQRWEPVLRRIADQVFGTPSQGITPEFAAVLRNQILTKDRRFFVWTRAGYAPRRVPGMLPRKYPVRRWQPADAAATHAPAEQARTNADVPGIATPGRQEKAAPAAPSSQGA
jgi:hypothetical protein